VAYRLELPAHTSIHPVFHVSQLKKAVGADHQVTPILPSDFALQLAPEQVLQTRAVLRGHSTIQQVLVKWNNLPASLATWEDYEALRQEFPRATAWGQAVLQGQGGVSSPSEQASTSAAEGRPRHQESAGPTRSMLESTGHARRLHAHMRPSLCNTYTEGCEGEELMT
jgi:hypothetical protein